MGECFDKHCSKQVFKRPQQALKNDNRHEEKQDVNNLVEHEHENRS